MQCQDSDLLAYLMALGGSKLVQARLVLELLPFFTIFYQGKCEPRRYRHNHEHSFTKLSLQRDGPLGQGGSSLVEPTRDG